MSILLIEAFLEHYQLKPNDVIGKEVLLGLTGKGTIVGVMKDFHTSSLHDKIEPVVLFNSPKYFGSILAHVAPNALPGVLSRHTRNMAKLCTYATIQLFFFR